MLQNSNNTKNEANYHSQNENQWSEFCGWKFARAKAWPPTFSARSFALSALTKRLTLSPSKKEQNIYIYIYIYIFFFFSNVESHVIIGYNENKDED